MKKSTMVALAERIRRDAASLVYVASVQMIHLGQRLIQIGFAWRGWAERELGMPDEPEQELELEPEIDA